MGKKTVDYEGLESYAADAREGLLHTFFSASKKGVACDVEVFHVGEKGDAPKVEIRNGTVGFLSDLIEGMNVGSILMRKQPMVVYLFDGRKAGIVGMLRRLCGGYSVDRIRAVYEKRGDA